MFIYLSVYLFISIVHHLLYLSIYNPIPLFFFVLILFFLGSLVDLFSFLSFLQLFIVIHCATFIHLSILCLFSFHSVSRVALHRFTLPVLEGVFS